MLFSTLLIEFHILFHLLLLDQTVESIRLRVRFQICLSNSCWNVQHRHERIALVGLLHLSVRLLRLLGRALTAALRPMGGFTLGVRGVLFIFLCTSLRFLGRLSFLVVNNNLLLSTLVSARNAILLDLRAEIKLFKRFLHLLRCRSLLLLILILELAE